MAPLALRTLLAALLLLNGFANAYDESKQLDEQVVESGGDPETTIDPLEGVQPEEPAEPLYPESVKRAEEVPQDDDEGNPENVETDEGNTEGNEVEEGVEIPANPELFEGDILDVNASDVDARNAVINPRMRWPKGIVPYIISNRFSRGEINVIHSAMQQYKRHTCIRFVPFNNRMHRDHIFIRPGVGCSANVGRRGGEQYVNLGRGCVYTGIVVHELMHAIGFWHEQSRSDRDKYVVIHWNNIPRSMAHNFQRFSHGEVDLLGLRYDIGSVMHYGAYYFALNSRRPTITTRNGGTRMGQRNGFSQLDIVKVNKFYRCSNGRRSLD